MNRVMKNLYIGGIHDLEKNFPTQIDVIVKLYTHKPCYPMMPHDVELLDYPCNDGVGWTDEFFEKVTDEMFDRICSGRSVLVMCAAGKSRSATMVLAYLVKCKNMSLQGAWELLRNVRPEADPSIDLVASLMKYLGVHPYLSSMVGR